MKKQRGFTLIELMIVVAIIAIFASIVIPNLLEKQIVFNERSAIVALSGIATAEQRYKEDKRLDANNNGVSEFGTLQELELSWPTRQARGYYFRVSFSRGGGTVTDREKYWQCFAWPIKYGATGTRTFYITGENNVMASEANIFSGPEGYRYTSETLDKIKWKKVDK